MPRCFVPTQLFRRFARAAKASHSFQTLFDEGSSSQGVKLGKAREARDLLLKTGCIKYAEEGVNRAKRELCERMGTYTLNVYAWRGCTEFFFETTTDTHFLPNYKKWRERQKASNCPLYSS